MLNWLELKGGVVVQIVLGRRDSRGWKVGHSVLLLLLLGLFTQLCFVPLVHKAVVLKLVLMALDRALRGRVGRGVTPTRDTCVARASARESPREPRVTVVLLALLVASERRHRRLQGHHGPMLACRRSIGTAGS